MNICNYFCKQILFYVHFGKYRSIIHIYRSTIHISKVYFSYFILFLNIQSNYFLRQLFRIKHIFIYYSNTRILHKIIYSIKLNVLKTKK